MEALTPEDLMKVAAQIDLLKIPKLHGLAGSRLLISALARDWGKDAARPVAEFFGIPVRVDPSLPFNRLEIRDARGRVKWRHDFQPVIAPAPDDRLILDA